MKIEIRKLGTDFNGTVYSRKITANKIKHYKIATVQSVINQFREVGDADTLREQIEKEVNEKVELEVLEPTFVNNYFSTISKSTPGLLEAPASIIEVLLKAGHKTEDDEKLPIKDISSVFLKDEPKIVESLCKVKSDDLFFDEKKISPSYLKLLNLINKPLNYLVRKLNSFIYSCFLKKAEQLNGIKIDKNAIIPYLNEYPKETIVRHSCTFLGISFEAPDLNRAKDNLLSDLRALNDMGLILGHYRLPYLMLIPDKVGSAVSNYTVGCILFLDSERLKKITKRNNILERKKPYSEFLGIKSEIVNGEFNWLDGICPDDKYEIELIRIGETNPMQAHIESYNQSKDLVNKIAKRQADFIKERQAISGDGMTLSQLKQIQEMKNNIKVD